MFIDVMIWATGMKSHKVSFHLLGKRIKTLSTKSGFQFTFLYLKEAFRLTIRFLSGQSETLSNKIAVKLDHTGLPVIIPFPLREVIRKRSFINDRGLIICLLTILSLYRVCPTKVKPSLDTITGSFEGLSETFNSNIIGSAVKDLVGDTKLRLGKFRIIGGESTGPNSYKSVWGSDIDAIAFIHYPKQMWSVLKWMFIHKAYLHLVWFIVIICLGSPVYVVCLLFGGQTAKLGRLAYVYDQAGKARVVAITNWWIQLCLKPLHDALFNILRPIETDGTFDQKAPLKKLMETPGKKYYSFDLSAATDRLPVSLQADILKHLGVEGSVWRDILNFKWFDPLSKEFVSYTVGQPMGAYSSWAMLAITHHVIVRMAALRVGITNFSDYCVLGDDVVIANDKVAQEYLNIMETLGLDINMSKTLQSESFAEFAKVYTGPGINITPVGPGLILRSLRSKYYTSRLIAELVSINLVNIHNVHRFLKTSPKYLRRSFGLIMWALRLSRLAPSKLPSDGKPIEGFSFSETRVGYGTGYIYLGPLLLMAEKRLDRDWVELTKSVKYFFLYGWRTSQTRLGTVAFTEMFLYIIKPGSWFFIKSFIRSYEELLRRQYRLQDIRGLMFRYIDPELHEVCVELLELSGMADIKNIDWGHSKIIKDQERKLKSLLQNWDIWYKVNN
uniref:RNA-dependent RNA polymerase n=1 Tax=Suillus luteus mitovirus 5 TaxID=3067814 RepID=A0AA50AHK6_9VIRU|nr:RNA-dependent RNA polymerase [Suillus luteus mitovirus 5]